MKYSKTILFMLYLGIIVLSVTGFVFHQVVVPDQTPGEPEEYLDHIDNGETSEDQLQYQQDEDFEIPEDPDFQYPLEIDPPKPDRNN